MASLPNIPNKKLNNGSEIPIMGFGTGTSWYKMDRFAALNPAMVAMATHAIQAGYRHLDAAEGYGTEPELGQAIRAAGVPRDQLFVTTKVAQTISEGSADDLPAALDNSLQRLGLDYVDLYLLHTPYFTGGTYDAAAVARVWAHMEAAQRAGKARAIGVSNFRQAHVEALLATATVAPAVNQIQFHASLQGAPAYAAWLQARGIAVASYMGLAPLTWLRAQVPAALHATLAAVAARCGGVSVATVLIRWQLDHGVVVLNTSTKPERLGEFFAALDLRLSAEDRDEITRVGAATHVRVPLTAAFDGDEIGPY